MAQVFARSAASAAKSRASEIEATGIEVIQIDEPWLRNDPEAARRYGVRVMGRALEGITVRRAVHMCFGYAFLAGNSKPKAYEFLAELADAPVDEISIEPAQPDIHLGVLKELSSK